MAARKGEEFEGDAVAGFLADPGVGVEQDAGIGILGEGGRDAQQGAAAGAGPVLLQGPVVAPVGQGGEVEVGGVPDESLGGPEGREGAEQALVHGAGGAVGIGGQGGRLGQHVEAGEQAGAAVHAPQVVGAVAADVGELERHEGQHGLQGGQRGRVRIAGLLDGAVQTVAADPGQQAEDAGGPLGVEGLLRPRVEQDAGRGAQPRRGGGALGARAAGQARKALGAQQVADHAQAGSLARLGVQTGLDVRHGEVRLAQLDHSLAHLLRGLLGGPSRCCRRPEEERRGILEAAEVAGHGIDRADGVAEAPGHRLGGLALEEEGAQDLVAAMERAAGLSEEDGERIGGHGGRLD